MVITLPHRKNLPQREGGRGGERRIKDRIDAPSKTRWLISFTRAISGPGCACGDRYQVITKLWLTVSNYKVRYLGDGLITGAITRARAVARRKARGLSWHAINPDHPIGKSQSCSCCRILLTRGARIILHTGQLTRRFNRGGDEARIKMSKSLEEPRRVSRGVDVKLHKKKNDKSDPITLRWSCKKSISRKLNAFLHLWETSVGEIQILQL